MPEEKGMSMLGASDVTNDTAADPNAISQEAKEYISNGMRLIHDEKMRDEIVKRLEGDDDVKALSDLTLSIIDRLDASLAANKTKAPDDIKWKGASVFMSQLIEVGKAAGVADPSEEEIKQAAGDAVGRYIKKGLANGTITEDQMREAYKVIQANNDGKAPLMNKKDVVTPQQSTPIQVQGQPATQMPTTSPGPDMGGAQ